MSNEHARIDSNLPRLLDQSIVDKHIARLLVKGSRAEITSLTKFAGARCLSVNDAVDEPHSCQYGDRGG